MTDRPIIFSAPMVRALLDGTKTQTRRVLKPELVQGARFGGTDRDGQWLFTKGPAYGKVKPRYAIGDRLWVRENFQLLSFGDYVPTKARPADQRYAATDACADLPVDVRGYPWRPSIHMPRWASRMTLTVTDVRVERLQDISEDDAIAEGILVGPPLSSMPESKGDIYHNGATDPIDGWTRSPVEAYRDLWEHINGHDAWCANPWIVAVSFEAHQCNIDQLEKQEAA